MVQNEVTQSTLFARVGEQAGTAIRETLDALGVRLVQRKINHALGTSAQIVHYETVRYIFSALAGFSVDMQALHALQDFDRVE